MQKTNIEFQIMFSLFFGLFLGLFSYGLFWTILFIILFEYYIFAYSTLYPPGEQVQNRVLVNVVSLFGWTVSRFLFLRETGFETCIEQTEICYNTFPN